MKARDIFASAATCCCIMGLLAILWTLHIQGNQVVDEMPSTDIQHSTRGKFPSRNSYKSKIKTLLNSQNRESEENSIEVLKRTEDRKLHVVRRSTGKNPIGFFSSIGSKISEAFQKTSNYFKSTSAVDNQVNINDVQEGSSVYGQNDDEDFRNDITSYSYPRISSESLSNENHYSIYEILPEKETLHLSKSHNERLKKDSVQAANELSPLERISAFGANGDPDLRFLNLGTPNPDIEITIEVVEADEDEGSWSLTNNKDSSDNAYPTVSFPGSQTTPDDKRNRRRKGDASKRYPGTSLRNSGKDMSAPGGPDSNLGIGLLDLMRHTDFELNQESVEETFVSEWSRWSSCSVTCGGGRKERSRSCGFSCTATETQDCNRDSCPSVLFDTTSPVPVYNYTELPAESFGQDEDFNLNSFERDTCEEWMSCRSERLVSYLARLNDLPGCPCSYPSNLNKNNAIWDSEKHQLFKWTDKSSDELWLEIYKHSAKYCIQSLLSSTSTSLAAQQCCYDEQKRLITRGPGAGTPQLISSEISPELNYRIDMMPWIICKGDWTKYNEVRPPDNANGCIENPLDAEYLQYLIDANVF